MLTRINQFLERAIPLLTPMGVVMGVTLPWVFLGLRPFIPWIFGTITLAGALKLRVRELGKAVAAPHILFLFFISTRVFFPLMIFLLSSLIFKNDPDTVSGYVLMYSVPTAVTSFLWVSIFRGDLALALGLILLDTLMAPIVVPGTIRLLLGTSINLDTTGMTISLICMVLIPTIVGVALNDLSQGKIPVLIKPCLDPLSKVCMVLLVCVNSAAVAPQIKPDNPRLWIIIAVCISFSVLIFTCAKLICLAGKIRQEKQTAFFFAAGLRNTGTAMTLGIEFFPGPAALPAVLGILFQQTLAVIMGRIFIGKIGGSENTESRDAAE